MPYFYRNPAAPMPNLPNSLGVVALVERDGALLLEARRDDGRWGLVSGVVEPDESLGADSSARRQRKRPRHHR